MTTSHLRRVVSVSVIALFLGVGASAPLAEAQEPLNIEELRAKAEAGDAISQYNLGVMYDFGNGVPQDDAAAYLWYNLATTYADASNRDRYAEARDLAAKRLTPEQRADTQRRATEFFEAHPPE